MENERGNRIGAPAPGYRNDRRGPRGNEEENKRLRQVARDLDALFAQFKIMKREVAEITHSYSRVENEFLTRTNGKDVQVFFHGGGKLKGRLAGADKYCLFVQKNGNETEPVLIFKSAVSYLEYV